MEKVGWKSTLKTPFSQRTQRRGFMTVLLPFTTCSNRTVAGFFPLLTCHVPSLSFSSTENTRSASP